VTQRPLGPIDWRARLAAHGVLGASHIPRIHGAKLLRALNEPAAAEAAFREQLERSPDDEGTVRGLASLLDELGRSDEAREIRRRSHARRCRALGLPDEALEDAIAYLEAAETGAKPPERPPAAHVAALFDDYAPRYDEKLRSTLAYRGPELVLEAAREALGDRGDLDVLDLGCGTGLAGGLVRPLARRLVGVDLSAGMLERARSRGVYDQLQHAELTAALKAEHAHFDLIIAVDVFTYFGSLELPVALAAARLAPGGVLVFTVERAERPGHHLQLSGRYTHHRDYLLTCAQAAGLRAVVAREAELRTEWDKPVIGHVLALRHDESTAR
jgi:predicted TPR repeat methyltransferase